MGQDAPNTSDSASSIYSYSTRLLRKESNSSVPSDLSPHKDNTGGLRRSGSGAMFTHTRGGVNKSVDLARGRWEAKIEAASVNDEASQSTLERTPSKARPRSMMISSRAGMFAEAVPENKSSAPSPAPRKVGTLNKMTSRWETRIQEAEPSPLARSGSLRATKPAAAPAAIEGKTSDAPVEAPAASTPATPAPPTHHFDDADDQSAAAGSTSAVALAGPTPEKVKPAATSNEGSLADVPGPARPRPQSAVDFTPTAVPRTPSSHNPEDTLAAARANALRRLEERKKAGLAVDEFKVELDPLPVAPPVHIPTLEKISITHVIPQALPPPPEPTIIKALPTKNGLYDRSLPPPPTNPQEPKSRTVSAEKNYAPSPLPKSRSVEISTPKPEAEPLPQLKPVSKEPKEPARSVDVAATLPKLRPVSASIDNGPKQTSQAEPLPQLKSAKEPPKGPQAEPLPQLRSVVRDAKEPALKTSEPEAVGTLRRLRPVSEFPESKDNNVQEELPKLRSVPKKDTELKKPRPQPVMATIEHVEAPSPRRLRPVSGTGEVVQTFPDAKDAPSVRKLRPTSMFGDSRASPEAVEAPSIRRLRPNSMFGDQRSSPETPEIPSIRRLRPVSLVSDPRDIPESPYAQQPQRSTPPSKADMSLAPAVNGKFEAPSLRKVKSSNSGAELTPPRALPQPPRTPSPGQTGLSDYRQSSPVGPGSLEAKLSDLKIEPGSPRKSVLLPKSPGRDTPPARSPLRPKSPAKEGYTKVLRPKTPTREAVTPEPRTPRSEPRTPKAVDKVSSTPEPQMQRQIQNGTPTKQTPSKPHPFDSPFGQTNGHIKSVIPQSLKSEAPQDSPSPSKKFAGLEFRAPTGPPKAGSVSTNNVSSLASRFGSPEKSGAAPAPSPRSRIPSMSSDRRRLGKHLPRIVSGDQGWDGDARRASATRKSSGPKSRKVSMATTMSPSKEENTPPPSLRSSLNQPPTPTPSHRDRATTPLSPSTVANSPSRTLSNTPTKKLRRDLVGTIPTRRTEVAGAEMKGLMKDLGSTPNRGANVKSGQGVSGMSNRLRLSSRLPLSASSAQLAPAPLPSKRLAGNNWMDKQRHAIAAYEYLCHVGEAQQWIEGCLDEELDVGVTEMEEGLRDGVILAKLARVFQGEEVVKKIWTEAKHRFRQTDNINYFLVFIRSVGMPETFIFELTDLYNAKNIPKVIFCIHVLSHLLARLGRAERMNNLVGQFEFTGEDFSYFRWLTYR